ncbi:MAG: amidohydrolase family protein [Kiritimatiellae bacterium]|nr:amidohydrolase family protein [Kiritimatiellia bacterium]
MLVDFHTHAFADALAPRAIAALSASSCTRPAIGGTVADLLASMRAAGVDRSVVLSIATKPSQFDAILRWGLAVRDAHPSLFPLASVHPDDPDALAHVDAAADAGFPGLKFHPYYQKFAVDEPRLFPLYERMAARRLFAIFHSGYDIGFPFEPLSSPSRLARVLDAVPALRVVASHLGGWNDWLEVARRLVGRDVYLETSYSLSELPPAVARRILLAHRPDRILFGTDSPWRAPADELRLWRALALPPALLSAAFSSNALSLLTASGSPR